MTGPVKSSCRLGSENHRHPPQKETPDQEETGEGRVVEEKRRERGIRR